MTFHYKKIKIEYIFKIDTKFKILFVLFLFCLIRFNVKKLYNKCIVIIKNIA